MPDVADYTVITDDPITLSVQQGSNVSRTFSLGTGVRHNQRGILQFFYSLPGNVTNLTFRVSVNGSTVRDISARGGSSGTLHEVLRDITRDNSNEVNVRIVSSSLVPGTGSGPMTISDIALFVQRQV